MTPLRHERMSVEEEALRPEFRLGWLAAEAGRDGGLAVQICWIQGGRELRRAEFLGSRTALPPDLKSELRELVGFVARPPACLMVWGSAWRELLLGTLSLAELAHVRVVDVRRLVIHLTDLPARASNSEIRRALGLAMVERDDGGVPEDQLQVVWALLPRASQRGWSWDQMSSHIQRRRLETPFTRYTFDLNTLRSLPECPAVYRLLGEDGRPVYIGKTGNLRRRLLEHFRPTDAPTDKLERLREQVRSLDFELVGSELEALLLEYRWIRRWKPPLNVQTRVELDADLVPCSPDRVAFVLRGRRPDTVEMFVWIGSRGWRISANVGRWPQRALREVHAALYGTEIRPRRPAVRLRSDELAMVQRYFRSHRSQLHWTEPSGPDDAEGFSSALYQLATYALRAPSDPAEFRF